MELTFGTKKPERVWDLYCPIVKTDTGYKIYLTNPIESPDEYNELCYTLENAKKHEIIDIKLNTPGGMIDSALMIIDAIKNSKATVRAELTGTVASAGTVVALSCKDIKVAPHTSFMIHNYSAGMSGKG